MRARTEAVIDLSAVKHNLAVAKQKAPQAKVMAMVKANGYGHGLVQMAQALNAADMLGVASIYEATVLRQHNITQPIAVLAGFYDSEELQIASANDLNVVLHHDYQLDIIEKTKTKNPILAWIKIDTGMNRLGFLPQQFLQALQRLQQNNNVKLQGLLTHFSKADALNDDFTNEQIKIFNTCVAKSKLPLSLANSAAVLQWPQAHQHWIRPGIMLYGCSPFSNDDASVHNLKPVMTLKSYVLAIKTIKKGEAVSYNGKWRAPKDSTIGVIAIGYGDGYPRNVANGTPVLIKGKKFPIVGVVCMDMLMVDLTTANNVNIGDEVILWGNNLPVENLAASLNTIGYELLSKLTPRVKFIYT